MPTLSTGDQKAILVAVGAVAASEIIAPGKLKKLFSPAVRSTNVDQVLDGADSDPTGQGAPIGPPGSRGGNVDGETAQSFLDLLGVQRQRLIGTFGADGANRPIIPSSLLAPVIDEWLGIRDKLKWPFVGFEFPANDSEFEIRARLRSTDRTVADTQCRLHDFGCDVLTGPRPLLDAIDAFQGLLLFRLDVQGQALRDAGGVDPGLTDEVFDRLRTIATRLDTAVIRPGSVVDEAKSELGKDISDNLLALPANAIGFLGDTAGNALGAFLLSDFGAIAAVGLLGWLALRR